MLSRFENVRREIFSSGNNFKLYNTVNYNFKGKDDIKLDPIYESSYTSSKYSNISELSTLNIRSSNYLVFAYRETLDGQFLNEEVFISYPHISYLKDWLYDVLSDLIDNQKKYYSKTGITEAGDIVHESKPFSMNKKLAICPYKIERNEELVNGIALFINEEDYFVEIDLNTFATMVDLIGNFDLLTQSSLTMIMNQNFEIMSKLDNNMGGSSSLNKNNNGFSRSLSKRPQRSHPNIFNRNTKNDDEEEIDNDVLDEDNEEEIEEPKKISRKPQKRKSSEKTVKRTKEMSKKQLDDMMNDDDEEENDPIISLDDALSMAEDDSDISDLELDDLDD